MAVMQGDLDEVKHLVEKGGDVNIKDDTEVRDETINDKVIEYL